VWEVGIFLGLLKIDGISSARALGSIDCLALFWGVLEADVQDSALHLQGQRTSGSSLLRGFDNSRRIPGRLLRKIRDDLQKGGIAEL
jgi:hypothetical protein